MTYSYSASARYARMEKEAKSLRAKARRLEAKGDLAAAMEIRDKVDGLRWEMLHLREHWS